MPSPSEGCTVEEALLGRHSVRAFLPRPVPRDQVERLLGLAARSASNSNIQPWHVHVLTGASKKRLSAAILEALVAEGRGEGDYPYQPAPDSWLEPFKTRRRTFGEKLYGETLGIPATDTESRELYRRRNYDFFGAPVGLILTVSRHPQHSALIDAGLFLQALMLAARSLGLDTCAQASFLDFSPVLRRELDIPDDHMVICGVALGHADTTHPLSRQLTSREPVESLATFH
ncbi:nitroreductase [Nocardioides sp. LHG3406-4]|uniref:nitroreductase n=1 Tax=Nocardioides sp. LHG3406-4 TaxID=2804575 RepID=UPI003CF08813